MGQSSSTSSSPENLASSIQSREYEQVHECITKHKRFIGATLEHGETVLMRAIRLHESYDDMLIIRLLLWEYPSAALLANSHGDTCLMLGAAMGNLELVSLLWHKITVRGQKLTQKHLLLRNECQFSAAMCAAFSGQLECMKQLLEWIADDSQREEEEFYCLLAASAGTGPDVLHIVEYLLEHCGVRVNRVDSHGLYALGVAMRDDVKSLLKNRTCQYLQLCYDRQVRPKESSGVEVSCSGKTAAENSATTVKHVPFWKFWKRSAVEVDLDADSGTWSKQLQEAHLRERHQEVCLD